MVNSNADKACIASPALPRGDCGDGAAALVSSTLAD